MITRSELDGIPVLHAPMPGPVAAGLVFRVGHADEALATRGITHMVEHLALHGQEVGEVHHNGATADVWTQFVVRGTEAEVVAYLNSVTAALSDLPLSRLETEKEILRTEASGRGGGPVQDLPLWRYGAVGHGAGAYPEWGLNGLTGEQVQAWAARWFTRQNAVLWITTGTLPEGLAPTLPEGVRQPLPEVTSALPRTPAFLSSGEGGVAVDAVVRRSTAAVLFTELLGRELFRALRQRGGYSYTAGADYRPRDAEYARILGVADALPEKQGAVLGGFVDVLAALRRGRIAQTDLDSLRQQALSRMDEPDHEVKGLPARAMDLLLGRPAQDREQLRAELAAVTVADLRAVAGEVAADALLLVPDGHTADWAGFAAAPTASTDRVQGAEYTRRDDRPVRLVVGAEGAMLTDGEKQVTVLWAECAAVLAFPDGGRHLIGRDGIRLAVEPTLYRDGAGLPGEVDLGAPAGTAVPMPKRPESQIPQPVPKQQRGRAPRQDPGGAWGRFTPYRRYAPVAIAMRLAETWTGLLLTALLLFLSLGYGFGEDQGAGAAPDPGAGTRHLVLSLGFGVLGLTLLAAASRYWWWRRQRTRAS